MVMIFFDTSRTASSFFPNATLRGTKKGYFFVMLASMHSPFKIKILITLNLYFIEFNQMIYKIYGGKPLN
jgi:hypothetical protein